MRPVGCRASLAVGRCPVTGPAGTLAEQVRDAIKTARAEHGWSAARLAVKVGCSAPTIIAIEHGTRTPTVPMLDRIAAALGLALYVGPADGVLARHVADARRLLAAAQIDADTRRRQLALLRGLGGAR